MIFVSDKMDIMEKEVVAAYFTVMAQAVCRGYL